MRACVQLIREHRTKVLNTVGLYILSHILAIDAAAVTKKFASMHLSELPAKETRNVVFDSIALLVSIYCKDRELPKQNMIYIYIHTYIYIYLTQKGTRLILFHAFLLIEDIVVFVL